MLRSASLADGSRKEKARVWQNDDNVGATDPMNLS
jgi:hypothetical protein